MFFSLHRTLNKSVNNKGGFGLVETIVGVAIFVLVAVSAYSAFSQILRVLSVLKTKTLATNLASEQIEIVRNLPYSDVGIINGLPVGKIPREQNLVRDGITFKVVTSVQDVDDPFDGQIGKTPNDLSPADYKLVEIVLQCQNCNYPEEIKFYSRVSPQSLETTGNNGSLFITVVDSNGQPIPEANVNVVNIATTSININELTNNEGVFQIVNAPTGTQTYAIAVTKNGYSTAKTYAMNDSENPFPNQVHATVSTGVVTAISFVIDGLSDLKIYSRKSTCAVVPSLDFRLYGSKLIGDETYKYDENLTTNSSGILDLPGMEWDDYIFDITDTAFDLAGANGVLPLSLNPGIDVDLFLILAPKDPKSLLVQVIDEQTGLVLPDAEVKITPTSGSSKTLFTGKGSMGQTDWSGDEYFSQNGNIEVSSIAGDLELTQVNGDYVSNGELISNTFDTGTTTDFSVVTWGNFDQPVGATAKFQIATNEIIDASTTWDFIGSDGTAGTYYETSGENISAIHDGDRYLRYKLFMETSDPEVTPIITNFAFTFGTDCAPPGQVLFQNLNSGFYSVLIKKDGYTDSSVANVAVSSDWQMFTAIMTPQ